MSGPLPGPDVGRPRLRSVVLSAADPAGAAAFWASMLGRRTVEDALVPGTATQLGLRFVRGPVPRPGLGRMHLHLTSTDLEQQQATVAAARRLGAREVDVGQQAEEGHLVLADPAGNAFCVIEPGNSFLAGCGFLGEIACDGTRAVGVFWSAVLGWPMVWDQDEQTAVQSPQGGTKVAWGGPPVRPVDADDPQHLELVVEGELEAELERLVALGATLRERRGHEVVLTDPDGVQFRLLEG